MNEEIAAEKGYKRILRSIKKILSRYFGKARWFLIGIVLTLLLQTLTSLNGCINNRIEGVQDEHDHLIRETGLKDVSSFSANKNGLCVVSCEIGRRGLVAVFDPDTGRQDYAGNGKRSRKSSRNSWRSRRSKRS